MAEQTIKTYVTKGFNNEGVVGSTPVKELSKPVDGITPDVMTMTSKDMKTGIEKIANAKVKVDSAVGDGMSSTKPVDSLKGKGKSAGMIGANNANHS